MYESPIDLIYKEMELLMGKCAKQLDEDIYTAIMQYGINVDKEELLRALQYDRNQYEAGYRDGKADAAPKWIPVSERLPKYNTFVIVFAEGIVGEAVLDDAAYWYWAGTDEYASGINVTHWMPLPEPPKEV